MPVNTIGKTDHTFVGQIAQHSVEFAVIPEFGIGDSGPGRLFSAACQPGLGIDVIGFQTE